MCSQPAFSFFSNDVFYAIKDMCHQSHLILSQTTNFSLKEFADDNSYFDENDRKFSERTQNTAGKGEIALTSNFSFSHGVFKRRALQTRKNKACLGKG